MAVFAAIKHSAGQGQSIFGALGLSLTILFVACVSINRFVQLTVIRLSPSGGAGPDLARFLPYSTDSVMFAWFAAWGPVLLVLAILMTRYFRRTG